MSKNLYDFSKEELKNLNQKMEAIEDTYKEETNRIKDKIEEYKDKSHDELLTELFSTVNEQKNNGTFDIEKINDMLERLSPYLSDVQKENLKGLIEKIK